MAWPRNRYAIDFARQRPAIEVMVLPALYGGIKPPMSFLQACRLSHALRLGIDSVELP